MRPRALDLFCCAGGASVGLYRSGFDVTGVDIVRHARYPFAFIEGNALTIDISGYDFIWASPVCQGYTSMRHAPGAKGDAHPKLIGKVRERLKLSGALWCIENVESARWDMIDPILLCGSMFGLGAQGCQLRRHRLFECNFPINALPCRHDGRPVIGVYGGHARKRSALAGGRTTRDEWDGGHKRAASEALGIDWMSLAELSEAIPPAYSEYIGHAALAQLRRIEEVAA